MLKDCSERKKSLLKTLIEECSMKDVHSRSASVNEKDKVAARSKSQPLYSHKEHEESSDQFTFQVHRAVQGAPSVVLRARQLCCQA
jgi:hypothetical protein